MTNPRTNLQLLNRLTAILPDAVPTTMTLSGPKPTAGNDIYEAYLFSLIVEAAITEGYSVEFKDAGGNRATSLHLRTSPGHITSARSKAGQKFTHAHLEVRNRPPLELHTGIFTVGKSRVAHEADVLLLSKDEADRCRSGNVDPQSSTALLAIEAKYYTNAVDLATAREFLGLSKDLSAKKIMFACTIANASAVALLAGTSTVEYDPGVLPYRAGETSLRSFVARLLRDYKDRR